VQQGLYETPLAWGGMGMRPLYAVRNAAFVGGWLHCLAHLRQLYGESIRDFDVGWDTGGRAAYSFHGEFRCSLDALELELGGGQRVWDVLGFSCHDAMQAERVKCQKLLSRAVLARRLEHFQGGLDARSRALTILQAASSEGRRPLASEWVVTAPFSARTTIPDQHFRLAVRKRLDMPVCNRGDRCHVLKGPGGRGGGRGTEGDCRRPRAPSAPCTCLLQPHADHAQHCARREICRRHHTFRDRCAAINQEAGNVVHTEAEVPGVLSSTKKEPIRADVLVRAMAPSPWEAAEIKVRHIFTSDGDVRPEVCAGGVDAMLRRVEAEVHAHYRPVRVRPWVVTSLGRPSEGLSADVRRLARLRLQRLDVSRAVSIPSVLQLLLQRWRAELSCALVLGDAEVYLAALGSGVRTRAGSGTEAGAMHVYDLQSMRVPY
jgi:hypothetical protein